MLGLSRDTKITPPVVLHASVRLDLCDRERLYVSDATLVALSSHGVMFEGVDAVVPSGAPLTMRYHTRDHRLGIAAGQVIGTEAGLLAVRFVHANKSILQLSRDLFQLRPALREGFLQMVLRGRRIRVDLLKTARLAPSDAVAARL